MKKYISIVLAAVITSILVACGGGNTPTTSIADGMTAASALAESAPKTDENGLPVAQGVQGITVGVCIYNFENDFMAKYRHEMRRYLEGGGAAVQIADGKSDQDAQIVQIEAFIAQGVDVLVINPVQSSRVSDLAQMCHAAGVPVVFVNREPDADEITRWKEQGMRCTYVGDDARQSGTFRAQMALELADQGDADKDGVLRYAVIMGDPESVGDYRTEFTRAVLNEADIEVEELFAQRGDWEKQKARELAVDALAQWGEKLDVIFCDNDTMALGAMEAIEEAGRRVGEDIYLLGVDAIPEALEAIVAGRMSGTLSNDFETQARLSSDLAAAYIAGEQVAYHHLVDYVKVTAENAAGLLETQERFL